MRSFFILVGIFYLLGCDASMPEFRSNAQMLTDPDGKAILYKGQYVMDCPRFSCSPDERRQYQDYWDFLSTNPPSSTAGY